MDRSKCDVLIIGMGLGAAAIAGSLASVGANIAMLPGAGRPRFNHLDGGIVDPVILSSVFGDIGTAPIHSINEHTVFRRDQLEAWAVDRIVKFVTIVDDFEEARATPHDTGQISIVDVTGERTLTANSVVLTEGANPKVGIAARLRPDFHPEDMIHFGRAFVEGAKVRRPMSGDWRTSWNMPAWFSVIPLPDGALVSASARIENIMRSGRDGRDTLRDLLESPFAEELDVYEFQGDIGMELVPLRSSDGPGTLGAHNIMISLDAIGTIDARSLHRFNASLSFGKEMGSMMASEWPNLVEWDDVGMSMWDVFTTSRTPYHDDSETGFIEDGPGKKRGLLGRLFNR